ncbi:hypothetical protein TrVE_jg5878 [Triparma verrucosa]|uniref:Raptor N-terminal CASPase-like domain-containing protein n=1 Tax=Triparma verrucosa TaxID=1606542 RepID=A0A9W7FF67_9STRA|nr:hypothetical protein TrVE_jg5878 [Triparma verrucosa]
MTSRRPPNLLPTNLPPPPPLVSTPSTPSSPPITWRLKERMKTVSVVLVLCLNIGTSPPDVSKPPNSSYLECWFDPSSTSRSKAREAIGQVLELQYLKWQQRAKYKQSLDPTVEEVRSTCTTMRRYAKSDRLLFHYNGHGVPRPTSNGEVWVFNKNYTQYIPLSVYELRSWIQTPSIVVLDCSNAGVLVPFFKGGVNGEDEGEDVKKVIVLGATSEGEILPTNPAFPADLFTSCLTTPIPIALRWFISQNPLSMQNVHPTAVDRIPGKLTDRKTPLGELNWIFTAITDTIAWNTLPSLLFQRLFRQDLLVASLFRNFLLADRILRSQGCTPCSVPSLPSTWNHGLWRSWDLAVETCLNGLIRSGVLQDVSQPSPNPQASDMYSIPPSMPQVPVPQLLSPGVRGFITAPFFAEQLTAFEVWLEFGRGRREVKAPEQLPVVLQVLLSQAHRVRALVLLRKFLDLGPWSVNLALSVGIFPYVLKLLQSPAPELRQVLVAIWAKIVAFDGSVQADLVKDDAIKCFILHLNWGLNSSVSSDVASAASQRVMAAFVLAAIIRNYVPGQTATHKANAHLACVNLLSSAELDPGAPQEVREAIENRVPPRFRLWLLICLAEMVSNFEPTQRDMYKQDYHLRLYARLSDSCSAVRAAAAYAVGKLLGGKPMQQYDIISARALVGACDDASPIVRYEATVAIGVCVGKYLNTFAVISNQMNPPSNGAAMQGDDDVGADLIDELTPTPTNPAIENLSGINNMQIDPEVAEEFAFIFTTLRGIQELDPHPNVSSAANQIVTVVQKRLEYLQILEHKGQTPVPELTEFSTLPPQLHKMTSMQTLNSGGGPNALQPPTLSKTLSAGVIDGHDSQVGMMFDNSFPPTVHKLPVSGFYEWKKASYAYEEDPTDNDNCRAEWLGDGDDADDLDPLSREGALKTYRKRKNEQKNHLAKGLAAKYAHLAPKAGGGLNKNSDDERNYELHNVVDDGESNGNSNKEGSSSKSVIKMDQSAVLDNESDMTSNLLFHPYENVLIVADDFDGISVWNFEAGKKEKFFSNQNKDESRMTSIDWLNDHILVTGCDDGSVRLWDNLIDFGGNGRPDGVKLASSFFAAPDMNAGQRGSGLVMEYQINKSLICAGNSSSVRVWDVAAEQLSGQFSTGSDVCVTCLTTAYDERLGEGGAFGQDVIVGGFGDGELKVWDLRERAGGGAGGVLGIVGGQWGGGSGTGVGRVGGGSGLERGRRQYDDVEQMSFTEHASWIVNTKFTSFGGRFELLSGSINGEAKFWDLRLPRSLRNLDIQRSPMTAFGVHNNIPLIASGAHAQFLKILDLDGDTKNVIRYHEGFLGQRIGAVSCLAWHPTRLLLAAGATDPFISLYSQ